MDAICVKGAGVRLTTKGRYAVTAMLDLGLHYNHGPIVLADIAKRQRISLSYLEQLFACLRKTGLVVSVRGPRGGYRLAKSANKISIAEVIAAVDEALDSRKCKGAGNCSDDQACLTHELWEELSDQILEFLTGISLEDLMARRRIKEVAKRQEYRVSQEISVDELMSTLS